MHLSTRFALRGAAVLAALLSSTELLAQDAAAQKAPAKMDSVKGLPIDGIAAIAQIHRRLYTSQDVRFVELSAYLEGLVEELEGAMRAAGREHTISLAAEPIQIATDKAVSVGVIVAVGVGVRIAGGVAVAVALGAAGSPTPSGVVLRGIGGMTAPTLMIPGCPGTHRIAIATTMTARTTARTARTRMPRA